MGRLRQPPAAQLGGAHAAHEPDVPVYAGLGINGQSVFVHEPARLVVARLSSWPAALDSTLEELELELVHALADALG